MMAAQAYEQPLNSPRSQNDDDAMDELMAATLLDQLDAHLNLLWETFCRATRVGFSDGDAMKLTMRIQDYDLAALNIRGDFRKNGTPV
jgi:hypothetical protein